MKKIKILTSLVGLTGLSMGLVPTIASCNSSGAYNVEFVSKTKERIFNEKTGGCSWTFKLADEQTAANTKVKLVDLKVDGADTQSVAGLIKYSYDSVGIIKVTVKTNTLLTQWPNGTKFEFGLQFTNKETKQSVSFDGFNLNVDDTIEVVNFCECDWSTFIERVTALYKNPQSEAEFFASFTDGENVITKWDDFVGLEKEFVMNNQTYKVRVIDTKHDYIVESGVTTDTPAFFTFESETLVSDSNGNYLTCNWDNSTNLDYTNSVLRWNLNGSGSGTAPSGLWTNSALSLLPSELQAGIKTVTKKVSTTSSYTLKSYNDKLFPLTYTEMAQSGSEYAKVEGTPYKYWSEHNTSAARIKYDAKGTKYYYWLTTPQTYNNEASFYVLINGNVMGGYVTARYRAIGASFAFCI